MSSSNIRPSSSARYKARIGLLVNLKDNTSTYAHILANKVDGRALRGSRHEALLEHYISEVATQLGCPREAIVLAGGAVVSILRGEEPRDIDFLYVGDLDDLFSTSVPSSTTIRDSANFVGVTLEVSGLEAQLLKHRNAVSLDDAIQQLDNFDFLHCCIGYCTLEGLVHPFVGGAAEDLYAHIFGKKLKVHNPVDRGRTLLRAFKFTQRGWSIHPKEQRKLVLKLKVSDIISVQRLEDIFTDPNAEDEGGSQ